ncbi:MAG: Ada metal-binding domain-containing protein [Pseudomonadota bacterium]
MMRTETSHDCIVEDQTPDAYWTALAERDSAYDGVFVFAVKTTKIYCRPSCPARRPLRKNVTFYALAREAEAAGYRA